MKSVIRPYSNTTAAFFITAAGYYRSTGRHLEGRKIRLSAYIKDRLTMHSHYHLIMHAKI